LRSKIRAVAVLIARTDALLALVASTDATRTLPIRARDEFTLWSSMVMLIAEACRVVHSQQSLDVCRHNNGIGIVSSSLGGGVQRAMTNGYKE
jgi:hypothetical protein